MADAHTAVQSWLAAFLAEEGGIAGTVHFCRDGGLHLAAAMNIPPKVMEAVAWVPSGKGMAGLALERGESVQTCNLQEDRSGAVKPGAKAVNAQAAVAMPVRNEAGEIVAVVGAAFADDREIQGAELDRLQRAAASVAERL
jgi:L-methionine (R)-S-oxide reductase